MPLQPIVRLPTAWSSGDDGWAVHLFEGELTLLDMDRMQHSGDQWIAKHPGKRVELVIIYPSDARMSAEERARMGRLMKHGEPRRAASATVIMAQGLRGAMHRSTLTALMMIAPPAHPAKVFGSTNDAVHWMFPHVSALTSVYTAVEQLESTLAEHLAQFRSR